MWRWRLVADRKPKEGERTVQGLIAGRKWEEATPPVTYFL